MKKKSALLVSISMVLVAVLALTTASFAWFSASMNPSLGGFNVNVTTANALLVAVKTDAKTPEQLTYKTSLAEGDIGDGVDNDILKDYTTITNSKTIEFKLNNVTPKNINTTSGNKITLTSGVPEFQKLTNSVSGDYTGGYTDATNPTNVSFDGATDNQIADKYYVKFDVYLKGNIAGDNDIEISLAKTSKFTPLLADGSEVAWAGADLNDIYYLTTALRVGFTWQKVWNTVTNAAVTDTPTEMSVVQVDDREPSHIGTTNIDATKAYDFAGTLMQNTNATIDGAVTQNDVKLFKMQKGFIYKATAYIWIEGNDAQTVNEISSGAFKSAINLLGTAVAPTP